jgi:hypothetical protein
MLHTLESTWRDEAVRKLAASQTRDDEEVAEAFA